MRSRVLRAMAIAAVFVASACSFDVSPLRSQAHATQAFDAAAPAPPLDAGAPTQAAPAATSNSPGSSGSGGATAMDDPDAAGTAAAAAATPMCMPLQRPECCAMNAAAAPVGGCPCPAELDSDHDGVPDCSDPAPHGWMKRLVIDGTQVDAMLSGFPVLVRLIDSELKAAAKPDGSDIQFLADDSVTSLAYEIERYDAQDGSLVAWVRVPQLTPGTDTNLYITYQDGASARSNPTDLWSSYEYVWHLNEDPGVAGDDNIRDSAQHANGTAQGRMTSADSVEAVAGRGIELDGIDDRISFHNVFAGAGPSTISAWVKLQGSDDDEGAMVIAFGRATQSAARFLMARDSKNGGATGAGFYSNDISGRPLIGARWTYLVWSWDGASSNLYIDGGLSTGPTAHRGANTDGTDGVLGASIFSYPRYLKGQLDELRVANGAQRSAFIHTEYMNQRPDSTFIKSVDAQVPKP